MAEFIEADDSVLSDDQIEMIDSLVEADFAAREALAEALGWDWEAGPGVPSVAQVTGDVVAALSEKGWALVPTPAVSGAES